MNCTLQNKNLLLPRSDLSPFFTYINSIKIHLPFFLLTCNSRFLHTHAGNAHKYCKEKAKHHYNVSQQLAKTSHMLLLSSAASVLLTMWWSDPPVLHYPSPDLNGPSKQLSHTGWVLSQQIMHFFHKKHQYNHGVYYISQSWVLRYVKQSWQDKSRIILYYMCNDFLKFSNNHS